MPTVPRYNQQKQVSEPMSVQMDKQKIEPVVSSDTKKFGMMEKAFDFMQKKVVEFDKARASEAASESTMWMDKAMTDAKARKGFNAFNVGQDTVAEYDKWVAERAKGLSKGLQRDMFMAEASKHRQDMSSVLMAHESKEIEAYEDQSYKSRMQTRQMDVAMTYNLGEKSVLQKINEAKGDIISRAETAGMGPEWVESETMKTVSDLHSSVISSMIADGNIAGAKAWKEKYGRHIFEGSSKRFDDAINSGVLAIQADKVSREIWDASGHDVGASLEAADQIPDTKMKDAVSSRVEKLDNKTKKISRSAELQNFKVAERMVRSGSELDDPIIAEMRLSDTDINHLKTLKKNIENGVVTEDKNVWVQLRDESINDPAVFSAEPLEKYKDLIPPEKMRLLEARQRRFRSQDASVMGEIEKDRVVNGVIESAWSSFSGGKAMTPGSDLEDDYNVFKYRAVEEATELMKRTKGSVTGAELQQVINTSLLNHVKGRVYGYKMKYTPYELIPPEEKTRIENALKDAGVPYDKNAVEYIYSSEKKK